MHQWAQHKSFYKQHFYRKGFSDTSEDCGYRNLYPFPWPSRMALDMLSVHLVIDVARVLPWDLLNTNLISWTRCLWSSKAVNC